MPKTEDQNAETSAKVTEAKSTVSKLVKPEVVNIVGTIVGLNFRKADGVKFKRDTHIVTVSSFLDNSLVDIFITERQFKEYGCEAYVYSGNVVNIAIEKCIKDVTGYFNESDDVEMTAHEATFAAFNRALDADPILLMTQLSRAGVQTELIKMIVSQVNTTRSTRSPIKTPVSNVSFMGE